LQSACNKTLRSMNRFYNVEDYLLQIEKINTIFDLPFLGSDVIAGFAGESIEDFEITLSNLEKSGLTQIHTFPYSIRNGTVGAERTEQLEDKEKERRAGLIKKISANKYSEFIAKNIGTVREVLIEKKLDKNDGMLKGVTRNYLTVHLDSNDLQLINTIKFVKITYAQNGKIYGKIV